MEALLRSDQMCLCQIFIPQGVSYFVMADLGEIGLVQFKDMNNDMNMFQRKFVGEVRRFGDMEFLLQSMANNLRKYKMKMERTSQNPEVLRLNKITELEWSIKHSAADIDKMILNDKTLKKELLNLVQFKYVLEKTPSLYNRKTFGETQPSVKMNLDVITGIIDRERALAFETMIWRMSKTNVFLKIIPLEAPIPDRLTNHKLNKNVFIVCFQGEQLRKRIQKICEGFRVTRYECPSDPDERALLLERLNKQIEEMGMVIDQTRDQLQVSLEKVAQSIEYWTIVVLKMKAVYHALNNFNMDVSDKMLIGECWVSNNDMPYIQTRLAECSKLAGGSMSAFLNPIEVTDEPPTLNRTTKFTMGFQTLVDAYGVAAYREVNPVLYTLVTFPFLFAVMFGDMGHALILTFFSIFMVTLEKKIEIRNVNSEIFNIFFAGRYLILMMGCYSLYTGLVYNDLFGKSINIFGSNWFVRTQDINRSLSVDSLELHPRKNFRGTPYMLGVDPVWIVAKNDIIFNNSFKMKLSIILGVSHMMLGLCVNVVNFIHFKHQYRIFLDFIPQLLILYCLFGYLVSMIFLKWSLYSANKKDVKRGTACAPSVLIYFINMLLFKDTDPKKGCDRYMYPGQRALQCALVATAALFIPVLLMGKPLYTRRRRKITQKQKLELLQNSIRSLRLHGPTSSGHSHSGAVTSSHTGGGSNKSMETPPAPGRHRRQSLYMRNMEEHNEFYDYISMEEAFESELDEKKEDTAFETLIFQMIHTVEYVLGTVSHTSSYLRLWALSLAHSQLSHVLWSKVLRIGLSFNGILGTFTLIASFFIWALFTVIILIVMEGLSAFLHTLRLHWVEFMSKFYAGTGYKFQPFSFKKLVEEHSSMKHRS